MLEKWLILGMVLTIPFVSVVGIFAKALGKWSYRQLYTVLLLTSLLLSGIIFVYSASQCDIDDAVRKTWAFQVCTAPIIGIVLFYNRPQKVSRTSYPLTNYHLTRAKKGYQRNYYSQEKKDSLLGRAGSLVQVLGPVIVLGLVNQKFGGGAGGGSVRVSGYRRSNGTFVHSYTRHRPR
jgi:hypothetical protein